MIGKKIKFKKLFDREQEGIILDKVIISHDSSVGVTGYLIEVTSNITIKTGDVTVIKATDVVKVMRDKSDT